MYEFRYQKGHLQSGPFNVKQRGLFMCACSLALQLLTQLRVAWRHAVNMPASFMLESQSGCREWTGVAPKASVPQMEPMFVQTADQFTQLCKNQHYPNLKAWLQHRGQLLVLSLAVLGQRRLECPIICVSGTRFDSFFGGATSEFVTVIKTFTKIFVDGTLCNHMFGLESILEHLQILGDHGGAKFISNLVWL